MLQHCEDVAYLVNWLQDERGMGEGPIEAQESPKWFLDTWERFRALVNTRQPKPVSTDFLFHQDRLLRDIAAEKGIVDVADIDPSPVDPRLAVWQGDLTSLAADGIVNAANSGLLGCWIPGHYCIDNEIHTFAGVQLRLECARIMQRQGHEEPVGQAKVTPGYNLPARHVIHTVGPMVKGAPTLDQRKQLAQCYTACLDAAAGNALATVGFCCISTGTFGFPQQEGARIAVETVRAWLDAHPGSTVERVIFAVYTDDDLRYYRELLG